MQAGLGGLLVGRRSFRRSGAEAIRLCFKVRSSLLGNPQEARHFARQADSGEARKVQAKAGKASSQAESKTEGDGKKRRRYDFVPAKSGPIDGRAYADWGKLKWRPVNKEKNKETLEVESSSASSPGKSTTTVKERSSGLKRDEFSVSLGTAPTSVKESSSRPRAEKKTESSSSKKSRSARSARRGAVEQQTVRQEAVSDEDSDSKVDLLKMAISSLKSGEAGGGTEEADEKLKNRVLSVLSEAVSDSSSDARAEVWSPTFRNRVEQALVDKGLVLEGSSGNEAETVMGQAVVASSSEAVSEEDEETTISDAEETDIDEQSHKKWADVLDFCEEARTDEDDEQVATEASDADELVVEEDGSDTDPEVDQFHVKQAEGNRSRSNEQQQEDEKRVDTQQKRAATAHARALLDALQDDEEEGDSVHNQHQKSLRVGIIGAPNAGKSCLLNYLVGTKVSAVSRKTNTTRSEILGVLTEVDTQLLFYDTPGLMVDWKGQAVRQDTRNRVQSAWAVTDHCEVLIVLVDAHRHIERPDQRVKRLVDRLGAKRHPTQKRVLCLNKVDLIRNKRELVPLAQELGGLPGFDSVFMISGLRGGGVRHLKEYLFDQAVFRPWEEEKGVVTDMNPVQIAKEVVWEHVLDNLHQEIPYELKHKHVSWKVLKDKSIRIEQQLLVHTENQKKILVGKKGALIRKIGMSAHDELCTRLGMKVHLILDVKVSSDNNMYANVENVPDEMWI